MSRLFEVAGKTALVTGGASGIGAMIARGLVRSGVRTYIVSRTEDQCRAVAAELSRDGECIPIAGDMSTTIGVDAVAERYNASEDSLAILINNAGIYIADSLDNVSSDSWDESFAINAKSPLFATKRFRGLLARAGSRRDPARIINIGSIISMPEYGIRPNSPCAYVSSKASLAQLTKVLAVHLADENITVNMVSPGMFTSSITRSYLQSRKAEADAAVPLGRIGSEEDIVGAVHFLASRAGAWVTGVNLPLDGGKRLVRAERIDAIDSDDEITNARS